MMSVDEVMADRSLRLECDDAWQSAFATRSDLSRFLLRDLGRNLSEFDTQEELPALITKIAFRRVEGDQWVIHAFQAACRYRRKNEKLWNFAQKAGWAPDLEAESLSALQNLAAQPGTRPLVRIYGSDIRRTGECAKAIGRIKTLHDLVDRLRGNVYLQILTSARRLSEPGSAVELGRHRSRLLDFRRLIVENAAPPAFPPREFPWIEEQLVFAASALQAAAVSPGPKPVNEALAELKDIVEVALPDLDRRLEAAARQLDLAGLVEKLESLRDDLLGEGLTADGLAGLEADIETLTTVDSRLTELMTLHQAWQRLDSALNPFENALGQPIEDVRRRWRILELRLNEVCPSGYEDCLPGLGSAVEEIVAALQAEDDMRLVIGFPDLATLLRDRFTAIDQDLLDECEVISRVGDSLKSVVEKL